MPDPSVPGPLHDYTASRAALIGVWDYRHMPAVPAARHSLERMRSMLTGPACGWPADSLRTFENLAQAGDTADALVSWLHEARDVALFYFVGHGTLDDEDALCLGLGATVTDPHRRATTSLPFAAVRRALVRSPARVKILVLDCCFAGQATRRDHALGPAADLLDAVGGTGAFTMAATGAYTTAWFETDQGVAQPQTYFTKYLADAVEAGLEDDPGAIRLRPLFERVRENLARDQRPIPQSRNVDTAHEFAFAHNIAAPRAGTPVPQPETAAAHPSPEPAARPAAGPVLVPASGAPSPAAVALAGREPLARPLTDGDRVAAQGDPDGVTVVPYRPVVPLSLVFALAWTLALVAWIVLAAVEIRATWPLWWPLVMVALGTVAVVGTAAGPLVDELTMSDGDGLKVLGVAAVPFSLGFSGWALIWAPHVSSHRLGTVVFLALEVTVLLTNLAFVRSAGVRKMRERINRDGSEGVRKVITDRWFDEFPFRSLRPALDALDALPAARFFGLDRSTWDGPLLGAVVCGRRIVLVGRLSGLEPGAYRVNRRSYRIEWQGVPSPETTKELVRAARVVAAWRFRGRSVRSLLVAAGVETDLPPDGRVVIVQPDALVAELTRLLADDRSEIDIATVMWARYRSRHRFDI